jgi:hypothetical protein
MRRATRPGGRPFGVVLVLMLVVMVGTPAGAQDPQFFGGYFQVEPQEGVLMGWHWAPNAPIRISIGTTEEALVTSSDAAGNWVAENVGGLAAGVPVRVTDSVNTKRHVIEHLTIQSTYLGYRTLLTTGTAAPNATVLVYAAQLFVGGKFRHLETVTADGDGRWVLRIEHAVPGSYAVYAWVSDDDSDSTTVQSVVDVFETACAGRAVPQAPFTDYRPSVHADAVDCAVWWGIAQGRTATSYAPKVAVSRAQMASFVARLIEAGGGSLPPPSPQGFTDLAGAGPHADRINQLAAVGVVRGRTATSYAPQAEVSRAQMATFLVNAYEYVADGRLPGGSSGFGDIAGNAHEVAIDKAFTAGFAQGKSASVYAPAEPVVREQMASFLTRVLERFATDGNTLRRL